MTKSQPLFERLKQKVSYEKFKKDFPESYLYAIFCILSKNEKEGDKIQFDFADIEKKKVAIAEYPFDEIKVTTQELLGNPEKINLEEIKIDIEDLWEKIEKIQAENQDKTSLNKVMGVLQNKTWDLTCMSATMDIIKIKINSETGENLLFKKENLMQYVQLKNTKPSSQ